MRTSLLLGLTAATILAGGMAAGAPAAQSIAPASTVREAAIVCGNTGCYTPQVQKAQRRKFQPMLGHG